MNLDRLQELAALKALDLLAKEESEELSQLLASADPKVKRELAAFSNVLALLPRALPPCQPPSHVKEGLMKKLATRNAPPQPPPPPPPPPAIPSFRFIQEAAKDNWRALPVPGAYVKLLSSPPNSGYALVLGKLDPGARYPAHTHHGPEEVYMLSGDLHMGDHVLHAGDFHHSDPGTVHGENFSETGCTILVVISTQDLQRNYVLNK